MTAQPGACAHEVIRTFGVAKAPIPDYAKRNDACTRARAVARILLLVAPVSLVDALAAARAAWQDDYAPAHCAPKNPTAYWAAVAIILRAATSASPQAAPRAWRPDWSHVHATSAASAAALWDVARRLQHKPTPAGMLDALYFLYHAVLAGELPLFVADTVTHAMEPRIHAQARTAVDGLWALLHEAVTVGSPPPRDVFGACVGIIIGMESLAALAEPPALRPCSAARYTDSAESRVLSHCEPAVLDFPHDAALFAEAYRAADHACSATMQMNLWKHPLHILRQYPFPGVDPLDLNAVPVPSPPPDPFVPTAMFPEDKSATLWMVYNHAASLVHTCAAPEVGVAIAVQLRKTAGRRTRWHCVPKSHARDVFGRLNQLGDAQPCMVPHGGKLYVEVGASWDPWLASFQGGSDVLELLQK